MSIRLAAVRRTAGGFQPRSADVRPEAGLREAGLVLINSIPDNGLKASSAFERCHMQPGRPADGPAAVRRHRSASTVPYLGPTIGELP
jgi:hypothetical protein